MAEVLDPTRQLFGQRIIAQEQSAELLTDRSKHLMEGLEGREAVAVVVDDSSSVWAAHSENLLAVERYVFFPSSRRQLRMPGQSLLELSRWGPARAPTQNTF